MKIVWAFWVALILCVGMVSCSDKKPGMNLSKISTIIPKEQSRFDQVEDLYFSHLGYKSLVTKSGDVVIADRELPSILLLSLDMKIKNSIREGKGPGEILDAYEMTKTLNGIIYINDSGNNKVLVFDENLSLLREFKPKPYEGTAIVNIFTDEGEKFRG
tara:strand:+ start:11260 stop:11736 length:477 start_codon:yes stop_codon:yes gene_type:complete